MHLALSDADGGLHARLRIQLRNKLSVSQVHGPSPSNGRTGWARWGKEAGGGSTRGLSCGNSCSKGTIVWVVQDERVDRGYGMGSF